MEMISPRCRIYVSIKHCACGSIQRSSRKTSGAAPNPGVRWPSEFPTSFQLAEQRRRSRESIIEVICQIPTFAAVKSNRHAQSGHLATTILSCRGLGRCVLKFKTRRARQVNILLHGGTITLRVRGCWSRD